ncbi:immunoglobulin domain-containing protein [Phthorimaea operculella]|nr:immunoglobulin domain-containing protein [Phthorimaea operculella]
MMAPRIIEPAPNQQLHVTSGQPVYLHCRATGDPQPTTHWDRDKAILHQQHEVEVEGSANVSNARMVVYNNGTLFIREVKEQDGDTYGCTAGSAAGLARNELLLVVHPEGEPLPGAESSGVGGKAVIVSVSVAGAYMVLVLALMVYCRRRRLQRRERATGTDGLSGPPNHGTVLLFGQLGGSACNFLTGLGTILKVKVGNGAPAQNGRLLPHDRDGSGADNSEVSAMSRASKKSGQYEHLAVPRTLLQEQITLGKSSSSSGTSSSPTTQCEHLAVPRTLLQEQITLGADNSEVSAMSRASKKSGQYEHLAVPRTLLTEQITLGKSVAARRQYGRWTKAVTEWFPRGAQ